MAAGNRFDGFSLAFPRAFRQMGALFPKNRALRSYSHRPPQTGVSGFGDATRQEALQVGELFVVR